MNSRRIPHFVLVNGSENSSGATSRILEHAAGELTRHGITSEIVTLATLDITACGPCGDCNWRAEPCAIQDDLPEVIRKLVASDGCIYAAPVHGFGLASTMQAYIERAGVGYLRFERPLADKIGGVISVGRRYSHVSMNAQLQQNMLLNRMIIPGSGYPAIVRTEQGDPFEDREGIASVDALCARLADLAHRMHLADSAVGALPVNERDF